ncbi:MAG: hypothetical protein MRY21_04125 [Simkaniaceae bacterium]|nr:hypothetical protein [Simkaniaceae bacterium]
MLDQTFSLIDIPRLFLLIGLELLLSSDNALAIASVSRSLPHDQRKKAIWIGYGASYLFRLIAIVAASFLMRLFWLQAIGGAYLIYIALKHSKAEPTAPQGSFWKVVLMIELTDLIFAIDSILAGFALVGTHYQPKLWLIYLGGIIGAAFVRFASIAVGKFLDKHPWLESLSFVMVAWIGLKLFAQAILIYMNIHSELVEGIFWVGVVAIALIGYTLYHVKKTRQ